MGQYTNAINTYFVVITFNVITLYCLNLLFYRIHNSRSGFDLMKVVHVSKAQALQRAGRAGREAPGTCYRLYTEEQFEALRKNTVPEIMR